MSEDDYGCLILVIIGAVIYAIIYFCSIIFYQEPPIDVSFRESLMFDGKVLQVKNTTTDKHLSCLMTVHNYTHQQKKSFSFVLSPRETQEVGVLEIGWRFSTGESVSIEVEGFRTYDCKVP